ncbi:AEC family transporter [Microtetraspora sp. NBRC 16547]|uniref:AEC family transporter n=1 Tax=Microtetraspora sp. NBRC 16547 TaxID=3030993 RepID=UPI0024A35582|nr:AEC family transporter [Microtetraspora sp. NBRC 16547]GLW99146.1 hypothetical protein Misp02_32330 [Microtetraspora sp. NBRC 16547]
MLSGFLPIWMIVAAGWVTNRFGILGSGAQAVLGRFSFTIAMPALLLLDLSAAEIRDIADPGVVVFAASMCTVFAAGLLLSRWVFRRRLGDQAIGGMAAAYVNSANLGIPVAVHVLGDSSFVIAAALFQMLFITPLILVLADLDVHGSSSDDGAGSWPSPFATPSSSPPVPVSPWRSSACSCRPRWHRHCGRSAPQPSRRRCSRWACR